MIREDDCSYKVPVAQLYIYIYLGAFIFRSLYVNLFLMDFTERRRRKAIIGVYALVCTHLLKVKVGLHLRSRTGTPVISLS